jgi:hypothetical protein
VETALPLKIIVIQRALTKLISYFLSIFVVLNPVFVIPGVLVELSGDNDAVVVVRDELVAVDKDVGDGRRMLV